MNMKAAEPKPDAIKRWLKKNGRLVSLAGLFVVFVTYIVKEGFSTGSKSSGTGKGHRNAGG
jgi:hypothetical protein